MAAYTSKSIVQRARSVAIGLCLTGLVSFVSGCTNQGPTTQPASMAERQDQALQNPFGYTPDMKQTDLTVGGHGDFDKEGLKHDQDILFNP